MLMSMLSREMNFWWGTMLGFGSYLLFDVVKELKKNSYIVLAWLVAAVAWIFVFLSCTNFIMAISICK